jgi:hypothetical protein
VARQQQRIIGLGSTDPEAISATPGARFGMCNKPAWWFEQRQPHSVILIRVCGSYCQLTSTFSKINGKRLTRMDAVKLNCLDLSVSWRQAT